MIQTLADSKVKKELNKRAMKKNILKSILLLLLFVISSNFTFAKAQKQMGIIVGYNVRLRSKPTLKSSIIAKLNTGDSAYVLDKTKKSIKLSENQDFMYRWYKIITRNSVKGWVYGKFFYIYSHSKRPNPIKIQNEKFLFAEFEEKVSSYSQNFEGDFYRFPCLINLKSAKVYPLYLSKEVNEKLKIKRKYDFFRLLTNTSISETIVYKRSKAIQSDIVQIPYTVNFQEGAQFYIFLIRFQKGKFVIIQAIKKEKQADWN